MNNQEILLQLFKYYAKFIPKNVLEKMFVKSNKKVPGYNETVAEILGAPDDYVIPEIDAYVFSANEGFLSKKIKNSNKTILYVEYGALSYTPNATHGVKEKLGLHIAHPYSASNNDNLSETLLMNEMHGILCSILDRMEKDQNNLDFCGDTKLIEFPAEIVAIDPPLFFDRTGWMAIFDYSTTNLL